MTRALQRLGYRVNHKRVPRFMREDNLLALRRKAYVSTTDSSHDRAAYANLVPAVTPSLKWPRVHSSKVVAPAGEVWDSAI